MCVSSIPRHDNSNTLTKRDPSHLQKNGVNAWLNFHNIKHSHTTAQLVRIKATKRDRRRVVAALNEGQKIYALPPDKEMFRGEERRDKKSPFGFHFCDSFSSLQKPSTNQGYIESTSSRWMSFSQIDLRFQGKPYWSEGKRWPAIYSSCLCRQPGAYNRINRFLMTAALSCAVVWDRWETNAWVRKRPDQVQRTLIRIPGGKRVGR